MRIALTPEQVAGLEAIRDATIRRALTDPDLWHSLTTDQQMQVFRVLYTPEQIADAIAMGLIPKS